MELGGGWPGGQITKQNVRVSTMHLNANCFKTSKYEIGGFIQIQNPPLEIVSKHE